MQKKSEIGEIKAALQMCFDIEEMAARVYRKFYERFSANDGARSFWHRLMTEEELHASLIEKKLEMLERVPEAFAQVKVDRRIILKAKNEIERLELRSMAKDIDIKDAVKIALAIEETVCEEKFMDLVNIRSTSLKSMFDTVIADSKRHREEVREFYVRL